MPGFTAATRCLSVKESNHNNCAVPDMGDGILRCPVIRKPVMKNAGNKKAGNKIDDNKKAANEIGGLTVTERLQTGKGKA